MDLCIFAFMMKRNARFNYLICIYLLGIAFFTLFRIAETVAYCATTEGPDDFGGQYLHALWNGFRFDTTVSTYLLALPLLLLIIGEMTRFTKRWYYAVIHYMLMVFYTVAFFGCSADIPYFCGFFTHIDVAALGWTDSFGTLVSTLFGDMTNVLYLLAYIAIVVGWWLLGRLVYKSTIYNLQSTDLPYRWSIPIAVLLTGALFLGMRGTVSKFPIKIGTAYFCSNPFLNQIGINPVFAFFKSIQEAGKDSNRAINLIDKEEAEAVWREQQEWPADESLEEATLRLPEGTNVVVVLMESMSVAKTSLSRGDDSYTPYLDSLMQRSMTFREAYSAGIHTYNGIYSTLYSRPCIPSRHTMKQAVIPQVYGLPQVLHEAGYHTAYFMTHDEDFDNMRGFLFGNGFDSVIGQHSYPASEVIGTWGVPDHVMFDHALLHCSQAASQGPFFATIMTCSDHAPYAIPSGIDFHPRSKDMNKQIVEYADWSLGRFMRMARRQPWYANTLFVFIADHGGVWGTNRYDMPLTYHHIPILFHNPAHLRSQRSDRLAMQVDLGPTLLAMLPLTWQNTTFGLNLLAQPRRYAYFCNDDKIGVIDNQYFYIYRTAEGIESLHLLSDTTAADLLSTQQPDSRRRADDMRHYGLALTQASDLNTNLPTH